MTAINALAEPFGTRDEVDRTVESMPAPLIRDRLVDARDGDRSMNPALLPDQKRVRLTHRHVEAFKLMWYECGCGHRERAWNSRDGVTPFGTQCPSCGGNLQHVDMDEYAPAHQPFIGQLVWRDGTPDEAVRIIRRRIKIYNETERERYVDELIVNARLSAEGKIRPDDSRFVNEFQLGWPVGIRATGETTF